MLIKVKQFISQKKESNAFRARLFFILPIFMLAVLSGLEVNAEEEMSFKKMLLMPGDLAEAHAEFEAKCESCHVHFEKSNQAPLCLECHEEVANDLDLAKGFHSKLLPVQKQDCKSCHSDHKGREYDMVGLDIEHFNHKNTDFPLLGKHKSLSCDTCHSKTSLNLKDENSRHNIKLPEGIIDLPQSSAFRFEAFECASCHENIHKSDSSTLRDKTKKIEMETEKCSSCHSEESWQKSEFDHDKTDFSLKGEHVGLECQSCHVEQNFSREISSDCQSCHIAKEPHLGIFGQQCSDCHSEKTWENNQYNHLKETGFHLKGKHDKLQCIDCHSELLKPTSKCITCHVNEDIHQGSNGTKCETCHNEDSWSKTSFNHSFSKTGFSLDGSHEKVECESCHLPGLSRKEMSLVNRSLNEINMGFVKEINLVRQCIDCHRVIDPHFGKLGKDCAQCHTTSKWNESVTFNHDFSEFPLTASHQLLVCESCHLSSDFSSQDSTCIACHEDDDAHEMTLGSQCETCHDSSVWEHWQFDHVTQTDFALNGAHNGLQCGLCHLPTKPTQEHPDSACFSCHGDDDIHQGGFGIECQQCHTENSFDDLSF